MFTYYAELSKDDLNRLKQLKSSIEHSKQNTPEYIHYLDEYYEEFSELFQSITDPLPPDCELEESLLPTYYIDFKKKYQSTGPYTFLNHCQVAKVVALVQVVHVKNKGKEVTAKLLEIFKGDQNYFKKDFFGNIQFDVYVGWSYASFEKGERALILLNKVSNEPVIVPTSNHKFKVETKNGLEMVIAQQKNKSFWHDIGVTIIEDNPFVIIPWHELKMWLQKKL